MNEFGSTISAVEAPAGRGRRRVGIIVAGMMQPGIRGDSCTGGVGTATKGWL
jgi:hypothetical protein